MWFWRDVSSLFNISLSLDSLATDRARERFLEPGSKTSGMEDMTCIALELSNVVVSLCKLTTADDATSFFVLLNHLASYISETSTSLIVNSTSSVFAPLGSDLFRILLIMETIELIVIPLFGCADGHAVGFRVPCNEANRDGTSDHMGEDI